MSDLTFKIMSGSPGLIITDIPTVSLPSKEEIVSDMQGEEEEQMFYNLEERRKSGQVKGKDFLSLLAFVACHQLCLPEFFLISITLVPLQTPAFLPFPTQAYLEARICYNDQDMNPGPFLRWTVNLDRSHSCSVLIEVRFYFRCLRATKQ